MLLFFTSKVASATFVSFIFQLSIRCLSKQVDKWSRNKYQGSCLYLFVSQFNIYEYKYSNFIFLSKCTATWVSVQQPKRLLSPYFKNKYWSLFPLWKEHTVMLIFKSSCFFWKTLPKCGYGVLLPGSLSLFSAVGNLQLYYCSLSFQFDVICLKSTSMMCKNWGH